MPCAKFILIFFHYDKMRAQYFRKVDENFSVDGKIDDPAIIADMKSHFRSWLSVVAPTEKNVPDGFDELRASGIVCVQMPFMSEVITVHQLSKIANLLNQLPRPTLVQCSHSTRASAVLSVMKSFNEDLSPEQIDAWAGEHGLKYLEKPKIRNLVHATIMHHKNLSPIIFRQLFEPESSTFTYILADSETKEAVIIDPVLETAERDAGIIRDLGLSLRYMINTHAHADHITGTAALKARYFPSCRSVISSSSGARADELVNDNDRVYFGSRYLTARFTPGHTSGCTTFILDDLSQCFSGDALLIRGCGRTDFQQGSSQALYSSVHDVIFTLPSETIIYPAHDYKGRCQTSVGEEKVLNPRLTRPLDEFVKIMSELNLPYPKKFDASVPTNLLDGESCLGAEPQSSGVSSLLASTTAAVGGKCGGCG